MKPSDFKQIVKESLREAFYTKKDVSESLGKEISIEVHNKWPSLGRPFINYIKYPAFLGKNVIPSEKPYRLTWFSPDENEAEGHIDMSLLQFNKLMNGEPDVEVYRKISEYIEADRIHINLDDETKEEPVVALEESVNNGALLLLEESVREIDLWLENKSVIDESMNMIVSGVNYKRTDRLDELVSYLQDMVVSPVLRTITDKAQIDFFQKNSVGFWNMLSADGSYYEKTEGNPGVGIINFYPAGISEQMARRIILGILKQLKSLNIQWGKLKREKSGAYKISDVIRIPIDVNNSTQYSGPAELNFSNINAYQIFHNILQYPGEHSFEMEAKDLMERIETVLKHDKSWIEKNVINKTDSDWPEAERVPQDIDNPHMDIIKQLAGDSPNGPRMIGMGLDSEGIEFRLIEIWKVAKWATEHGHNKIVVG